MISDPQKPNTRKPANPIGVGAPVALLIIGGVIVGGLLGQPSIGFLVGVGISLLLILGNVVLSRRK